MKNRKYFVLLCISAVLLTACGTETKTAQQTESTAENVTEETTGKYENIVDENVDVDDNMFFGSLDEFTSFTASEEFAENYSFLSNPQSQSAIQTYSNDSEPFTPLIPQFDTNRYEISKIRVYPSGYAYYIKNISEGKSIAVSVHPTIYYHTYEELVEVANMNHVLEVENTETTVWGDTPALVQSIQFSDPVEYSIQAMIDENNKVYMSCDGMTPEELTACLNEFTFE